VTSDTVTAVIFVAADAGIARLGGSSEKEITQQKGNAVNETETMESTRTIAAAPAITRGGLQSWLLDRIAFYLDKPAGAIDPAVELARYGVDSVYAISIISDIEDHLQVEVDVAEARRRGTVDALTDYLLELVA
jgi:acyl carrier protein